MGVVCKAEHTRLGRHVAIRFLPEQFACDKAAMERFQREAHTAVKKGPPTGTPRITFDTQCNRSRSDFATYRGSKNAKVETVHCFVATSS
jgi:hypothetical protein